MIPAESKRPRSVAFRVVVACSAALFALSALVQLNDPDPFAWVLIYATAAAICLVALLRAPPLPVVLGLALIAIVWALTLAPRALREQPPLAEVFSSTRMLSPGVEEAREALGLSLIALAMSFIAARSRRASR
jgi:hypothetical protein